MTAPAARGGKKRIKVIVPFPFDEEALAIRSSGLPLEIRDEDTEVVYVPVKNGPDNFDSEHDSVLADFFIFEEGLRSEEEGFDAVCVDSTSDSGVAALRSRLNIPVLGPGLVVFHVACMLGYRFSVLTISKLWTRNPERFLRRHGLLDHLVSVRYADVAPDLRNLLSKQRDEVFPVLEAEAWKCIEDGAELIVLGGTNLHQVHEYLRERIPVPVLNPGPIQYKMARLFIELGLVQSKVTYSPPKTPKDELIHRLATAADVRPAGTAP